MSQSPKPSVSRIAVPVITPNVSNSARPSFGIATVSPPPRTFDPRPFPSVSETRGVSVSPVSVGTHSPISPSVVAPSITPPSNGALIGTPSSPPPPGTRNPSPSATSHTSQGTTPSPGNLTNESPRPAGAVTPVSVAISPSSSPQASSKGVPALSGGRTSTPSPPEPEVITVQGNKPPRDNLPPSPPPDRGSVTGVGSPRAPQRDAGDSPRQGDKAQSGGLGAGGISGVAIMSLILVAAVGAVLYKTCAALPAGGILPATFVTVLGK